jgi:hypothetical protein
MEWTKIKELTMKEYSGMTELRKKCVRQEGTTVCYFFSVSHKTCRLTYAEISGIAIKYLKLSKKDVAS